MLINATKSDGTKIEYSTFDEMIKDIGNIISLDFNKFQFTNDNAQIFANALKDNTSIKQIGFAEISYTEHIKKIYEGIKNNNSIEGLYFFKCDIDATSLAEALKGKANFKKLSFNDNYFDRDGIIKIAEVVQTLPNLEKLTFRGNRPQISSNRLAIKLSETLKNHKTLKYLDVSCNSIDDNSMSALADSLLTLDSLTELYTYSNTNDDLTVPKYIELLKKGKLTDFDFQINPTSDELKNQFNEALSEFRKRINPEKTDVTDVNFEQPKTQSNKLLIGAMAATLVVAGAAIALSAIFIGSVAIMAGVIAGIAVVATVAEGLLFNKLRSQQKTAMAVPLADSSKGLYGNSKTPEQPLEVNDKSQSYSHTQNQQKRNSITSSTPGIK